MPIYANRQSRFGKPDISWQAGWPQHIAHLQDLGSSAALYIPDLQCLFAGPEQRATSKSECSFLYRDIDVCSFASARQVERMARAMVTQFGMSQAWNVAEKLRG